MGARVIWHTEAIRIDPHDSMAGFEAGPRGGRHLDPDFDLRRSSNRAEAETLANPSRHGRFQDVTRLRIERPHELRKAAHDRIRSDRPQMALDLIGRDPDAQGNRGGSRIRLEIAGARRTPLLIEAAGLVGGRDLEMNLDPARTRIREIQWARGRLLREPRHQHDPHPSDLRPTPAQTGLQTCYDSPIPNPLSANAIPLRRPPRPAL